MNFIDYSFFTLLKHAPSRSFTQSWVSRCALLFCWSLRSRTQAPPSRLPGRRSRIRNCRGVRGGPLPPPRWRRRVSCFSRLLLKTCPRRCPECSITTSRLGRTPTRQSAPNRRCVLKCFFTWDGDHALVLLALADAQGTGRLRRLRASGPPRFLRIGSRHTTRNSDLLSCGGTSSRPLDGTS